MAIEISKHPGIDEKNDDSTQQSEADLSESPRTVHGFSWVVVLIAIYSSTFLFGLDNTITAEVQPAVVARFGSIDRLPWISVAFLMAAGSTTLFWGRMYGQWNVKWLYITCLVIFEVGSAVCGASPSMTALIVGRALCGFGGAGMYTGVMVLISVLTSDKERPAYLGLSGLFWGIGTVLGPIIGGAFTSSGATWRWSFYINLCIGGAFAPVYFLLIPSMDPRPEAKYRERIAEIDYAGTLLMVGIFVSGVMAINFGGTVYAWNSGQIIALFIVAGVLIMVFAVQQGLCLFTNPQRRIFPVPFLFNRNVVLLFLIECCAATIAFIPIYFTPLYYQFVRDDSAIDAGVKLLPLVFFLVASIIINGVVMGFYSRYMVWYLFGSILALIGSSLMYTVDENTSDARIYGYTILIGTGVGSFIQLGFSVIQSLVDSSELATAVGLVTFAQLSAPAVSLSMANVIFLNETTRKIASAFPSLSLETINGIISGVRGDVLAQLSGGDRDLINSYLVTGLNNGYIIAMSAAALAVILSAFLPRGKMMADQ